jgi:AraC-like DNA-binding protein
VDLLERIHHHSRQPGLAWRVGQVAKSVTCGRFAQAISSSRNLGTALRRLSDYYPLFQDETQLTLAVGERWSVLSYGILDPDIWPRHQDALYTLGIFAHLIKKAAPDAWDEVEITVEAERCMTDADLSAIVHAPVIYGGAANALRFPTRILDCQMNLMPPVKDMLEDDMSRYLALKRRQASVSDRVRHIIYQNMLEGIISQDDVARHLGVSTRTLRRKLAEERLSYQDILDQCRMRMAARELRTHGATSLAEIALKLGYSEHSSFSRAFVRWTGVAPQDYRRETLTS